MRRTIGAIIGLFVGYITGALLGAALVSLLSTNTHDKSQELVTTSLLAAGPIGALIGAVVGVMRR